MSYPPPNKTGRKYGEVMEYILTVAMKKGQITIKDLLPKLTMVSARTALNNMTKAGHLRVVKRGGTGRYAPPTVYGLPEGKR